VSPTQSGKEVRIVQNIDDGDLIAVINIEDAACCDGDCDCGPDCPPDCC